MNFMKFEEGEHAFVVLFIIIIGLAAGIFVPIAALITFAFYRIRMKYNFTWQKDLVGRDENATAQTEPF